MIFEASVIMTTISSLYDGGVMQFNADGGRVFAFFDNFYIAHPEPEKLINIFNALPQAIKKNGHLIKCPVYSEEDIRRQDEKVAELTHTIFQYTNACDRNTDTFRTALTVAPSNAGLLINAEEYSPEELQPLFEHLRKKLVYGPVLIKTSGGIYTFNLNEITPTIISTPILPQPVKDTTISQDDITNLRISLANVNTVEDFLKNL